MFLPRIGLQEAKKLLPVETSGELAGREYHRVSLMRLAASRVLAPGVAFGTVLSILPRSTRKPWE